MGNAQHFTAEQRDELECLVANGIERAFRDIGLNRKEVFEMRKDLTFLREWRLSCDSVRSRGVLVLVGLAVTGFVGLLVMGLLTWVRGH